MTERARAHHVVSKFYLRHFADEAGMLATVELPGQRSFVQSVNSASVRKDYYTGIGQDGQETDVAEGAFGVIEGRAADAWRTVASGKWPLSASEREDIAAWIALHALRADSVRTSMSQIGTDMLQLEIMMGGRARLREVLRKEGEPFDDESVDKEWVSLFTDPVQVAVHANHHLTYIADALPRLTALLLDRWWVLTRFERRCLATSDTPVAVIPNERDMAVGMGTGLGTADEIHLPFTRRACLTMALRSSLEADLAGMPDREQAGSTQVALFSNSVTSRNARRFLFHHPADDPLAGLDLPPRREREIVQSGDPWRFMRPEDRQVLLDAGVKAWLPDDVASE